MNVDFRQSLEGLSGNQLLQMMKSFLSKGISAVQKGFEQIANEVMVFREEKNLIEEKNKFRPWHYVKTSNRWRNICNGP